MTIIEIHKGSDAFNRLTRIVQSGETYLIRIQQRSDGVAIKANEGVWSPTLACSVGAPEPSQPRSVLAHSPWEALVYAIETCESADLVKDTVERWLNQHGYDVVLSDEMGS